MNEVLPSLKEELETMINSIKDDDKVCLINGVSIYDTLDTNEIQLSNGINIVSGKIFKTFVSIMEKHDNKLPEALQNSIVLECLMTPKDFKCNIVQCKWIILIAGFSTIVRNKEQQFIAYKGRLQISAIFAK